MAGCTSWMNGRSSSKESESGEWSAWIPPPIAGKLSTSSLGVVKGRVGKVSDGLERDLSACAAPCRSVFFELLDLGLFDRVAHALAGVQLLDVLVQLGGLEAAE